MSRDYSHEIGQEVRSISGGYELDREGTLEVDGHTIVYAVGVKANKDLEDALKEKVPAVYCIGDCLEPRDIMAAIDEGARVGCEV